jgi:hypothetical protein
MERPAAHDRTLPSATANSAAQSTERWVLPTAASTWSSGRATRTTPGPPATATYIRSLPTVALRRLAVPVAPAKAASTSGRRP